MRNVTRESASFLSVDHPLLDRFAVETPVGAYPKCGQLLFPEQAIDCGLMHAQVSRQLAHGEHSRLDIGLGLRMCHVIPSFLPNVVSTNLDEKASRSIRMTLPSRRRSTLRGLADKDRRRYWRPRALGARSSLVRRVAGICFARKRRSIEYR